VCSSRPQQKKAAVQHKFLSELKRGDMILTASGIIGTVKALSDKIVTIEVDNDVCIKVLRSQITENASSLNKTEEKSS
jgi:preprotein translocase subunit YajC